MNSRLGFALRACGTAACVGTLSQATRLNPRVPPLQLVGEGPGVRTKLGGPNLPGHLILSTSEARAKELI